MRFEAKFRQRTASNARTNRQRCTVSGAGRSWPSPGPCILQQRRSSRSSESPAAFPSSGPHPLAAALPLRGKRVLLTAARQYAGTLAALLITAGASPIWLPGIEITRLPEQQCQELDAALDSLTEFDFLAFTSKNGIYAIMGRLQNLKGGLEAAVSYIRSSGVKVCALGGDGELLWARFGLEVHVSPLVPTTGGLVDELRRRGLSMGARMLVPVPLVTGGLQLPPGLPRFIAGLRKVGAEPTCVPSYLTTPGLPGPGGPDAVIPERMLLEGGHIAAIVFSSTAEAQGLCRLMGGQEVLVAAIQRHGIVLAAHGPFTAAGVSELLGLPIPVISKQGATTFEGVVAALAESIHS